MQSATRNLRLEGLVDNEAGQLLPGMFAEVIIQRPVVEEVVTVPQAAITFSPYGDSVFTIREMHRRKWRIDACRRQRLRDDRQHAW